MKASLLSTKREGWLLSYSNNCLQCYFYLIVLLKYFLVYRETIDDLKSLNCSLYVFKPFVFWWYFEFIENHFKYSIFTLCWLSNSFAIYLIEHNPLGFTVRYDRYLKANTWHLVILKQKEASTNYLMQLVGSRRKNRAKWKHIRSIFLFFVNTISFLFISLLFQRRWAW